jgi:serine/threonine protein kinase
VQQAFNAEAARHAALRHPHVAFVYGVVNQSDYAESSNVAQIVQESCDGTLEQSLITSRFDSRHWRVESFVDMAIDVLRGLAYLSTQLVHRDVSLRSVLRCGTAFKIGQFACAIPVNYVDSEARRGLVPLRWTAPEGFTGAFCAASDMWSFGLLLWQAVQYATAQPYRDHDYVPDAVLGGALPPMPRECPDCIRDVILRCLVKDPAARPTPMQLLLDCEHLRRSLSTTLLQCPVPFPDDDKSFADFNALRLASSRSIRSPRLQDPNAASFEAAPGAE